jgi:hypothetical protein
MQLRVISLLISVFVLAGCAGMNTSYNANSPEGIECTFEAKKGAAAVQSTGRSGLNFDQFFKEQELFNLCMASKQANNPSSKNTYSKSSFDAESKRLNLKAESNCQKDELKEYYSKTPCHVAGITFEHMSDATKITPAQKIAMQKARALADELNKEQLAINRNFGGAMGAKVSDLIESTTTPQNDKNNLDLYNGKISWGDYNQKRKEIITNFSEAIRKLR